MKNPTTIQFEALEVCNGILSQVNFYLGRRRLSNGTHSIFIKLERTLSRRSYSDAIFHLESLKLTKGDIKEVYYLPCKWLCTMAAIREGLDSGPRRDSLEADIGALICKWLGSWYEGRLVHYHPDGIHISECRASSIIRDQTEPLGYRMRY